MRSCRTLLIYCVSLIGCFLAGIAIDLACGGEIDPYDYYVSFFHNNLQGEKDYRPFYFTNYQFLYDYTEPVSEAEINADEWASYLGKDVSPKDVHRAMYHLNQNTDAALQDGYLRSGEKLPDSLANNTFLKAMLLKRNAGALKYYRFAKGVEKLANIAYDRWNPRPIDSLGLRNAGVAALKSALLEKDKFIQLRYYYQAQRLLHYGTGYKEALNIYNKYIAGNPSQSHVKGWALALKAGELRRLKDTVQAAYLFTKVFAEYPERRVQAYQNYNYIGIKGPQVLALASNNSERAMICAIEGFGNPEADIEPLRKVYQYDPSSPMIGVLLIREINKLEETYLTNKLLKNNIAITGIYYANSGENKKLPQLVAHINKLNAFCKQLVAERKYPDYNIANLAGAYLAWMQGDNANGFVWLRAMNSEKLNPAMNDQKQIIQLLLSAQNIQKLNEVNETQLLPALKWLDEKVKAEVKKPDPNNYDYTDDNKFTLTARNFYQQILAPAYLKQGDTTRAAMALLKSSGEYTTDFWQNHLHSSQLSRIIRWKKTPPVTPYLSFLTNKLSAYKLNYLDDLLGTAYLREHQYTKAINILKQIDAVTLNKYPDDYDKGDPFIDRINDYPKVLRYGKTKGFNKLQFAVAMNELEQKVKTDPANAPSYYYRIATGLYNASHYGNAWYLISYNWSSSDFGRAEKYSYDADYIKTQNAEKYYLLACSLSVNQEFKAKCTFMAAKCEQKQAVMPEYFTPGYDNAEKDYLLQLRSNDYFTELRSKYRKTAIFKKAVSECSYLKDFMLTPKQ